MRKKPAIAGRTLVALLLWLSGYASLIHAVENAHAHAAQSAFPISASAWASMIAARESLQCQAFSSSSILR